MTEAQKKWSITTREGYAVVMALKTFLNFYLMSRSTLTIHVDHKALENIFTTVKSNTASSMVHRWAIYLMGYNFKVSYIRGEYNYADAFSRYFCSRKEERENKKLII